MFDIGFLELLLLAIVGLLVLGPERLPQAVRSISLWLGRMRRGFESLRTEFEREIGADEIKRDLHNEKVMDSLRKAEEELKQTNRRLREEIDSTESKVRETAGSIAAKPETTSSTSEKPSDEPEPVRRSE